MDEASAQSEVAEIALPASFGVGFIAALGDPDNRLRDALLLSIALCVVATVVFWWALRMQFPLLNWG